MKYPNITLSRVEAVWNKLGGEEGVEKFLSGKLVIQEPQQSFLLNLNRVNTITVPAVQRFVTKDCLKEANVGWTGDNFNKLFCDKVEENVPEANLAVSRLKRASLDAQILAELGDKAEVKLSYLFDLLKKQSHGEDGILLTNGYANIFYVCGDEGILWAVSAYWYSDYRCWGVGACSVEYPSGWVDGYQVFSRDS